MINSKRGGYKGKLLLVIAILLVSVWLVSALNQSSGNTTGVGILPVEESTDIEEPISVLPAEPPTQEIPSESSTSAAISVPSVPSDENQNVPVEEPIVTVHEAPVQEAVIPPVEEPAPNLLSMFLNIVLDKVKFFIGEVIEIQATLTDQHSNPLPDKKIDFYADEQIIGTNLTDSAGTAKVSWNTSSWLPGAYTIRADYAGDGVLEPVSATRSVILQGGDSSNITTEALPIPENVTLPALAKVFNEDNIGFDRGYAQEYLQLRNNFADLKFKRLFDAPEGITFTVGNKINNLRGIQTDKGKFAIDLVHCDEFESFCIFRVNGVPTGKLFATENAKDGKRDSFDVDGDYILKVNSVKVNQCDNHRFCHLGYEGYHEIDVVVERR